MEQVHGTCKPSKSEAEDVISSMPDNVITNILDRLPLEEAVRTDILSRNWRYKWTMLTQLIFDKRFFEYLQGLDRSKYFDGRNLSRLLLHFKGDITKFVLYTPDRHTLTCEDINHWVLFACRKGIKDLTLINTSEKLPKLPSQLFSCTKLEHLKLCDCFLCFLPTFCGFPNLLSLDLTMVRFGSYECGEFIARCPLLEVLKIVDFEDIGKVKLGSIAKLVNLKILRLSLFALDKRRDNTSSGILQLMCLLPKLQELDIDFWGCKFIAEATVTNKTFLSLRTLTLCGIDFSSDNTVLFIIEMISGSPNLQTLKITVTYKKDPQLHAPSSLDFDCKNTMGQLQLQTVVLDRFSGSEIEASLIKYILACSPLLKNIVIKPESSWIDGYRGKFLFASKLLKFHRASTVAEIDLS